MENKSSVWRHANRAKQIIDGANDTGGHYNKENAQFF
jgi:hypothetical protein